MAVTTSGATTAEAVLPYEQAIGVRPGARARGARRAEHGDQDVLRLPDHLRRRAQHPGLPGLPRPARRPAGAQRERPSSRRSGSGWRSTAGSAAGAGSPGRTTSTRTCRRTSRPQPVRRADRLRRLPRRRAGRRQPTFDGCEIERAHMEEDTGKSLHVGGATGRIHGADYSLVDYNRAGIPLIEIVTKPITGTGERAPEVARAYVSALRDLLRALGVSRRADGAGLAALRRERLACAPSPEAAARHPDRDQERQLAAQRRARRPLRDHAGRRRSSAGGGRSCRRPGTGTRTPAVTTAGRREDRRGGLPLLPGARPGADRPRRGLGGGAAGHAARAAGRSTGAGCRPSGASPTSRCATWSTPARWT